MDQILSFLPDLLEQVMPRHKEGSQAAGQADSMYRKAQSVSQFEDPMIIQDLLERRAGIEELHQQTSSKRAYINRNIHQEGISEEQKQSIVNQASDISERTGISLGIEGKELDEQIQSLTQNLSKLDDVVNGIYGEHQNVVSQIEEQVSPNMAAHLNYGYRAIAPEMQSQRVDAMGTSEMVKGILNEFEGGDKELTRMFRESGINAPGKFRKMASRWSGFGDMYPYELELEKMTQDQEGTLREKAKQYIMDEGNREFARVEQEYGARSQEQRDILSRWQEGSSENITPDLARLKEQGYLKTEESDKILGNLDQFVNSRDAQQMAANLVSLNRGDNEDYSSLFGYTKPQQPRGYRPDFNSLGQTGSPANLNNMQNIPQDKHGSSLPRYPQRIAQVQQHSEDSPITNKEDILANWQNNEELLSSDLQELLANDLLTSERLKNIKDDPSSFLAGSEATRHAGNLSNLRSAQTGISSEGTQPPSTPPAGEFSNNRFINNEFINNRYSDQGQSAQGAAMAMPAAGAVYPGGNVGGGIAEASAMGEPFLSGEGVSGAPEASDGSYGGGAFFGGAGAASLGASAIRNGIGFGSSSRATELKSFGSKVSSKVGGAGGLSKLGALGFITHGLSAGGKILLPGQDSGAESIANSASTMATPAATTAGAMLGSAILPVGGTIAGGALGYAAGKTVGPAVNAALDPYADFVAQQKQYEAVSGENLQGAGATQSGYGDFLSTLNPLGTTDTIQEAQRGAKYSNPFMPTEQIQSLTDSLLELGLSTEETTAMIKPLSDVMGDFNLDPQMVATLAETGMSEGSLGESNARFMAQQIQQTAGEGFNQQDVTGNVQTAMDTLGPTMGYTNAQDTGIAYSNFFSQGTDETDMLFRNEGTVGKVMQADQQLASSPGSLAAMGVDPMMSPENPEYQSELAGGRVRLANQLVDAAPRDPETGDVNAIGLAQIESMKSQPPYSDVFGQMSAPEIIALAEDKNLTEQGARNSSNQTRNERVNKAEEQKRTARGEGVGTGIKRAGSEHDPGKQMNFFAGLNTNRNPTVSRGGTDLILSSQEQQQNVGKEESIGAVGQFVKEGKKKADYDKVQLAGGGTLADAADDPELLARINKGHQKIKVGDQKMTLAEFNEKKLAGEASIGPKGGLNLGGQNSGSGGGKHIIELSEEAKKWFKVQDNREGNTVSAGVQAAQDRYRRNHGGQQLNDAPIYGS